MSAAVRRLAAISSHLSRPQITLTRNPVQSAKLGSSYSTQSPNMTGVKEVVDQAIKQNKVAVFGKSWCPYCQRAKAILAAVTKDSDLLYWDLDKREDGSDIQAYLKSLNGQGTVPHVYIQQEFIGGCSDLQAIPESKLKAKISA